MWFPLGLLRLGEMSQCLCRVGQAEGAEQCCSRSGGHGEGALTGSGGHGEGPEQAPGGRTHHGTLGSTW